MVCDKRMPRNLKVKIYKIVVRPVMVYGAETWALRKKEERKLERTEMRMLRWILGVSLRDHVSNEEVRKRARIECISDVIRKAKLTWYEHVLRRQEEHPIKRAWQSQVKGRRTRGRQKLRWKDGLETEMRKLGLTEQDAVDRKRWRRLVKGANP